MLTLSRISIAFKTKSTTRSGCALLCFTYPAVITAPLQTACKTSNPILLIDKLSRC